jgi:SAM-dependent methyltransferase
MACGRKLLLRLFGRPKGLLGCLGGLIMARMNRDAAERVIALLEVRPNDWVLEIGFGPGVAIQLLVERVPGGFIAGVDPSLAMVGQAAARNASALTASGLICVTVGSKRCPLPMRASTRRSQSIRCKCGWMWPRVCGRYGACSNLPARSCSVSR